VPDRTFWPLPADNTAPTLYLWGRRLVEMMRAGKHVETVTGSVTLTAGTTSAVAQTAVLSTSVVFVQPTNAAARALGLVAVTSKSQGVGFTLTTPAAAGTETYDYVVVR